MAFKIHREFSLHSKTYSDLNIIQKKVIQRLIGLITNTPTSILDIGCGNGGVFSSITWSIDFFVGLDFSEKMLDLHPKDETVKLIVRDFNQSKCFNNIVAPQRIISSAALHWADNLENVFQKISVIDAPVSFSIFTSGTFEALHKTASIPYFLQSAEEIIETAKKFFNAEYEILNYQLDFSSVREMFDYIKKSGVSGSRNVLSYTQIKELMENYPLSYLEFEIVLIHENS